MTAGTYYLTEYQARLIKACDEIVKHGFGEITISVSEIRNDYKTKVIILAGRSWVYFVEKELPKFREDSGL